AHAARNGSAGGGCGTGPGVISFASPIPASFNCVPALISKLLYEVSRVSYPPPFGPNASSVGTYPVQPFASSTTNVNGNLLDCLMSSPSCTKYSAGFETNTAGPT